MTTATRGLALAALLAAPVAHATGTLREAFQAAPCVVSVAHGGTFSNDVGRVNDSWNALNASMQQGLVAALQREHVAVVTLFHPVLATDDAARRTDLLRVAGEHGCTYVVELSASGGADDALGVSVSVRRLAPGGVPASGAADARPELGATVYARRYAYSTRGDFGDTFRPADAGAGYAGQVLDAPMAP
jgi:hypothetical protein